MHFGRLRAYLHPLTLVGLLLVALPLSAKELTGADIAAKIVKDSGFRWEGAKTRLKMVLIDKGGAKKVRLLEVLGRRDDGRLETIVRFLSPTDVAGTAFLMRETKKGGSEQYIYLPGLRRTRRIVGREREGSFMGSDFSYADMQRADMRGAEHRRLPDEKVGKTDTYVIESVPKKGSNAAYSKVTTWVRKSDFVPLRTRFYGKGGKLIKTLYARRVKEMDGHPVVVEARMQSEDGHATALIVESLERRDDLPDSSFTPAALER